MLPSQFKNEYMPEDDSGLVLTSSQEEMLTNENRSVLDFSDINIMMDLPFSGPYPSLCEPTRPTFFPPPTGPLPVLDDWAGMYNFQLSLSSTSGRSIVYSEKLGKLFANINTKIPVEFKMLEVICEEFMVRALPVFTATQDYQLPVKRCISHSMLEGESNQGVHANHVNHVIRCDHQSAQYHCDDQSGRLSVVVTMEAPQAGVDKTKLMYEFVCKNSCSGGMNRRPIAVVFTLERHSGEVVGRRHLKVRICSCPKRDEKKEELNSKCSGQPEKKRHPPQSAASKRLKKEEEDIYYLPVAGYNRFVRAAMFLHGHQNTEAHLENRALTPCEVALQKKYYNIMLTDRCTPHANSSPLTPQD